MQKRLKFLLFSSIVLNTIFSGCTKRDQIDNKLVNVKIEADRLAHSKGFNDFASQYIISLAKFSKYSSFLSKSSDTKETHFFLDTTSRDYEMLMIAKNDLDNQCLKIMHENPVLIDMDSSLAEKVIIEAMNIKLSMTDEATVLMKEYTNDILNGAIYTSLDNTLTNFNRRYHTETPKITIDEVWDCAKRALGITAGSIITIAALQQLAKDKIQKIVIEVSKWLAKRAGWVGLFILVADFSSCLYAESRD